MHSSRLALLNEIAANRPVKQDDFVQNVLQIVSEMKKKEQGRHDIQQSQKVTKMIDHLILNNKDRLIHKKKHSKEKKFQDKKQPIPKKEVVHHIFVTGRIHQLNPPMSRSYYPLQLNM